MLAENRWAMCTRQNGGKMGRITAWISRYQKKQTQKVAFFVRWLDTNAPEIAGNGANLLSGAFCAFALYTHRVEK